MRIYPVERLVKQEIADVSFLEPQFCIDQAFYENSAQFYPKIKAEIEEIADVRGLKYVVVKIYPYRYIPAKKILEITKNISLKLSWRLKPGVVSKASLQKDKFLKTMLKGFRNLPQGLSEETVEGENSIIQLAGSITRPTDLLTGTPTDYLIICASDFCYSPYLDMLVSHRASPRGGNYDVAIVDIQDIYSATFPDEAGSETNDQLIKIFIKYVYDHWNGADPPVKFLLLVGDAATENNEDVPNSWSIPAHISDNIYFDNRIASDFWYICLSPDYPAYLGSDLNDLAGDVAIGRLPVRDEAQLETVVNKIIGYETVLPLLPGEWRSRAGLFSGFSSVDTVFSDMAVWALGIMRDVFLIPNGMDILEAHRVDYSNDSTGNASFREEFLSAFNDGSAIVVYSSHGFTDLVKWGRPGDYDPLGYFRVQHMPSLTNEGMLPLVFVVACLTGEFDNPDTQSLGEAMFVNFPSGAITFLGPSRLADVAAVYFVADIIGEIFYNQNSIIGTAILSAKNNSAFYVDRQLYNLLGDPALDISEVIVRTGSDNTAPVISDVAFQTTINSATINWITDEPATTQVEYGLNTGYENITQLDTQPLYSHIKEITGLARNTVYHFRVRSIDAAGNEAVSADFVFTTKLVSADGISVWAD
jgi:hypothetical protein